MGTSRTDRFSSLCGGWAVRSAAIPVGVSLLAIAVGQPASMFVVPTSSRASSLPQGSPLF
ncbi:hypothetical protein C1X61_04580 [Pseudomonas sp. FW215-T2]|nr:hypothetical protein C1X61_04580 [Pseudomonas sp. FW215-T2]PNA14299.1 hypothetical protein C1X62_07600 [Pseudomonas sp. FW215-R3]PNB38900.1 hypothetical protein C1X63_05600 [Pseudomonas sp. FW305-131]